MKILKLCECYLSGFSYLKNYKDYNNAKKILIAIQIISYLTVVLPTAALIAKSLYGRVKKPSDTTPKTFSNPIKIVENDEGSPEATPSNSQPTSTSTDADSQSQKLTPPSSDSSASLPPSTPPSPTPTTPRFSPASSPPLSPPTSSSFASLKRYF